jgi:hypothetical protein
MYRHSISRHRIISWNARRTARENGSMTAAFRAGGARGSFTRTAIEWLSALRVTVNQAYYWLLSPSLTAVLRQSDKVYDKDSGLPVGKLGTGRSPKRCQSWFQAAKCAACRTRIAKEAVHGYQHTSHYYSSRFAARRRRLVRPWTLVLILKG